MKTCVLVLSLFFSLTGYCRHATAETIVTLNRYVGLPDFTRSRQTFWVKNDSDYQRVISHDIPELSDQFSCSDLLDLHQYLPLGEMFSRGYISADNVQFYLPLYKIFHPSQVSLIQISHPELPSNAKPIPGTSVLDQFFLSKLPKVQSTLGLIAAQWWDAAQSEIKFTPAPWQLEEHLKDFQLDRNVYRFITEDGRALKGAEDDMRIAQQKGALIQLEEIHSFGPEYGIKDGWKTIHILSDSLAAAYEKMFPGTRLKIPSTKPGEAVFMIPLQHFFDVMHPEEQSPLLSGLMKEGLDIDTATRFMQFFKLLEFTDMDAALNGRLAPKPVVVADYSDLQGQIMHAYLAYHHYSEEKIDAIHQLLIHHPLVGYKARYPHAQDYALTPFTQVYLAERNSVLLTNLAPAEAARDPNYVMSVIAGLFTDRLNLMNDFGQGLGLNEVFNFAHDQEVRFTVSTKDKGISAQLMKIGMPLAREVRVTGGNALSTDELMDAVKKGGFQGMMNARNTTEHLYFHEIPFHEMMLKVQDYVRSGNRRWEIFFGGGTVEKSLLDVTGL